MSDQRAYIVVPFERVGSSLGPRCAMVVHEVAKARQLALGLSRRVPGVAVLERRTNSETGDDVDTLIAEFGVVPTAFPDGTNWTMRLN